MRLSIVIVALTLLPSMMVSTAAERSKAKAKTHTVTMRGMVFIPADLTVKSGDTVVWKNTDIVAHTATSPAGRFDSGFVAPAKSWKFTARKKGDLPYVCTYHPGMKGTLHVR
jgi:plastocyanin